MKKTLRSVKESPSAWWTNNSTQAARRRGSRRGLLNSKARTLMCGSNDLCISIYEHRGKVVTLNAVDTQYVPTTGPLANFRRRRIFARPPARTRCHQVHMLASVAILFHPDRRNHSSTAQLEPMSLPHGKSLIPELPTRLPELSDDVPRTIFAYLAGSGALSSGQGHTCVCWNWCDLIYAMNTLWSTIMVDGMFYVYFCNRQTCSREQPVGQSIHAGIERSRPANTRLRWDWKGLVWHGCNRFGSPRRPLRYLAKKR